MTDPDKGLKTLNKIVEKLHFLASNEGLHRGLVNFKAKVYALETSLKWLPDDEASVQTVQEIHREALLEGISFVSEALLEGVDTGSSLDELVKEIKSQSGAPSRGKLYELVS